MNKPLTNEELVGALKIKARKLGANIHRYLRLNEIQPVDLVRETIGMLNRTQPPVNIMGREYGAGTALHMLDEDALIEEAVKLKDEMCEDNWWICIGDEVYVAKELRKLVEQ